MLNQSVVNLEETPPILKSNQNYNVVTIGDLHANIVKLVSILTHVGVFKITDKGYQSLVRIYKTSHLSSKDLADFQSTLDHHITSFNPKIVIRLLGDCLCDRGANDILFLKFLRFLSFNRVSYRIVFSNHDAEFLKTLFEYPITPPKEDFVSNYDLEQTISFCKLLCSVSQGIVSWSEIQTLFHNYYLPSLTLIDYSTTNQENDIFIYTHAPNTLFYIKKLGNSLGVDIDDRTPQTLISSLEQLNERFAYLIYSQELITYLNPSNELFAFIWRRESEVLFNTSSQELLFPTYIFGHDNNYQKDRIEIFQRVIRLDNLLGKSQLSNPEKLTYANASLLCDHKNYPLKRVDLSIERPNKAEILWQRWTKQAIELQVFQEPNAYGKLCIANNHLELAFNHIRLNPDASQDKLEDLLHSLKKPELHKDLLVIKDIFIRMSETHQIIRKIRYHLASYSPYNQALELQKTIIQSQINDYYNGKINREMVINQVRASVQNIFQLFSHEIHWQKLIINTLLSTVLFTSVLTLAYTTSIPLFTLLLTLFLMAQATQFIRPIPFVSEHEARSQELLKILPNKT